MTTPVDVKTRWPGVVLLVLAVVFVVLGLGLAFTIYGEISLLLAVVTAGCGAVLLSRGRSRGSPRR